MDINFSRNLIKGRIAEVIFEQMIREEGKYDVIPFGYEHTVPTLAQYRSSFSEVHKVIENIADAPDFALISTDKTSLYLVEVKYQSFLNLDLIRQYSEMLLERWESPWIFIATPQGFYCAPCSSICKNNAISNLQESWVEKDKQEEYLKLLNEFEK